MKISDYNLESCKLSVENIIKDKIYIFYDKKNRNIGVKFLSNFC